MADSSPEKYAPPDRRTTEKASEAVAYLHRQRSELDTTSAAATENLNEVVRRVTTTSVDEINRVIRTLENVRDMMTKEGDRVTREITSYASLGSSATAAMWVILDNLKKWKETPENSTRLRGLDN
jgi:uncharacterized protein YoxC